jgi:hypothetical protein
MMRWYWIFQIRFKEDSKRLESQDYRICTESAQNLQTWHRMYFKVCWKLGAAAWMGSVTWSINASPPRRGTWFRCVLIGWDVSIGWDCLQPPQGYIGYIHALTHWMGCLGCLALESPGTDSPGFPGIPRDRLCLSCVLLRPKEDFLQMCPRNLSDLKDLNELRRFMWLCKTNTLLRTARRMKRYENNRTGTYRFIQYAMFFSALFQWSSKCSQVWLWLHNHKLWQSAYFAFCKHVCLHLVRSRTSASQSESKQRWQARKRRMEDTWKTHGRWKTRVG